MLKRQHPQLNFVALCHDLSDQSLIDRSSVIICLISHQSVLDLDEAGVIPNSIGENALRSVA